jgi:hypothetical protein
MLGNLAATVVALGWVCCHTVSEPAYASVDSDPSHPVIKSSDPAV